MARQSVCMSVVRSRKFVSIAMALVLLVVAMRSVTGAEQASGVLLYQQASGGAFRYDVDLKNTGSTNIGTLWYAWVPGQDFLGVSPTNVVSPTGWTAQVTHTGSGDGFAVQWVNNTGPLQPGQTLSGFGFDTTESPTTLAGNSPFFSAVPISTTFIYSGAPFSDAGVQFNINPTAHPWQNPFAPLDVNNDGIVSPADIDIMVGALVSGGIRSLGVPTIADTLPRFADTNGDSLLSPVDLLEVINQVNLSFATPASAAHPLAVSAVAVVAIPEPGSAGLLVIGGALLAAAWQRCERVRRAGDRQRA